MKHYYITDQSLFISKIVDMVTQIVLHPPSGTCSLKRKNRNHPSDPVSVAVRRPCDGGTVHTSQSCLVLSLATLYTLSREGPVHRGRKSEYCFHLSSIISSSHEDGAQCSYQLQHLFCTFFNKCVFREVYENVQCNAADENRVTAVEPEQSKESWAVALRLQLHHHV